MKYIAKALIIGAGALLVSACGSDSNNESNSESNTVFTGEQYDVRYCEVALANVEGDQLDLAIYGTQGLNDCPQEQWEALNAVIIAQENDTLQAILNGPRHWVLDGITYTPANNTREVKEFGEIEMQYLASMNLELFGVPEPYTVGSVERDTIWHYSEGREVYELQDPSGTRYIMQSYSLASDASLQIEELHTLGERLSLPEGWFFSTRILEEALEVEGIGGIAGVVKDDLDNTYQRIPSDNTLYSSCGGNSQLL